MSPPTWVALLPLTAAAPDAVRVSPPSVRLDSPEASQQLLVTAPTGDATRAAKYEVADPAVAAVDASGMVTPKGEGRTEVRVRHGGTTELVPRLVADKIAERDPSLVVRVTKASGEVDADDPYAAYQIPDDFMW